MYLPNILSCNKTSLIIISEDKNLKWRFVSERVQKEKYLTDKNIEEKAEKWFEVLQKYSKHTNFCFNRCALLVIDMQNFFLDKSSHAYVPSAPSILRNVKKIITAFRKREFPIIFTRFSLNEEDRGMMVKWWNDRVMEGSRDSMLIEEFNLENAIVLRKKSYSAFHETPLLSILRERKIDSIVITGLMTHLCCDTTARHAFMHDFKVYFVIDATATYTEELHLSSLRALVHGFAIPIRTGDLVEGML